MSADNSQPPLNPHSLIPQLLHSLYTSVNVMLANFGLSVIRVLVGVGVLVAVLMVWSVAASLRNRKSFSLQDEEVPLDANISESPDRLHGGVFRKTRYPEGIERSIA